MQTPLKGLNPRLSKGETLESVVVCELVLTDGSGDWVNLEIGKNRNGPGRRQIGRVKFGSKSVGEEGAAVLLELVPDELLKAPEDDSTRGLGGNQRRVLNILKSQLCNVRDKIRPFGLEGPSVKAVSETSIIDEYVSASAGDQPNKKREACVRALNGLISRGLIAKRDLPEGPMVWLVME